MNTVVSIWGENMLGYLSMDIICSSKLTVFLQLRSWKTVRFSKQIKSADRYPSIFSQQMEAIVYIWRHYLRTSAQDLLYDFNNNYTPKKRRWEKFTKRFYVASRLPQILGEKVSKFY